MDNAVERDSWQARVLLEVLDESLGIVKPRGRFGAIILSVFSHGMDDGLVYMLDALFPDFKGIGAPFVGSAAKIDKAGRIVADVVLRDDQPITKDFVLFRCMRDMEATLRRLADRLRLSDTDRLKLFVAARNWVVADRRLDPTMDPADPDARRLVWH